MSNRLLQRNLRLLAGLYCYRRSISVATGNCRRIPLSHSWSNPQHFNFRTLHNSVEANGDHDKLKSTWAKPIEIIKEPHFCSSMQNLLLYSPSCVSADETGERLFLSDTNHHRIIIFSNDGMILDCIGSSGPGFEDGDFDTAKLFRPAASFYDAYEDCIYIVDSENHAIRRADLESRVLDTVYPISRIKKNTSLWGWICEKLGLQTDANTKAENIDSDVSSLSFPWHLIKSVDNNFLVSDQSFETLWTVDFASGQIKEVARGSPKVLDICRDLILDKLSLLKQMPHDFLKQQTDVDCSLEKLISCITICQNDIIMCDTVGQGVVKLSRDSGICSNIQFSNLGILGLPYWLFYPLERFYADAAGLPGPQIDHLENFSLLPGRVDIRLHIDIPSDTEIVEPLQENCIWRQARGAATEVSGAVSAVDSSAKVGVAQQWYDEIDNVAFSTPESELILEDDVATASDTESKDGRIRIDCTVNTSPGTSEVIIYAALYLRLKRNNPDLGIERMSQIMNSGRNGEENRRKRDAGYDLLLRLKSEVREVVMMKPLHVRIRFDCPDHPKADNSKSIVLTDSFVDVNVCLA